jgi:hypothetical protein
MLVLYSEDMRVSKPPETFSADAENYSNIKCNDAAQYGLLMENQYNVDSLSELSCLLTQTSFIHEADLSNLVLNNNVSKTQSELLTHRLF